MEILENIQELGVASLGVLLIGGEGDLVSGLDWQVLITDGVTGANLRSLGIQGNCELATLHDLLGLASVVDDGLMVCMVTVGAVHANNVHSTLAESVEGLDIVGLWSDCSDDGSTAEILWHLLLSIETSSKLQLGLVLHVVKRGNHLDRYGVVYEVKIGCDVGRVLTL